MPSHPPASTIEEFSQRLAAVRSRIAAACEPAGRNPVEVRLLPVSKTVAVARLRIAHAAGCRTLGENRVQEAWGKWQAMADLPGLEWAIIGPLQTNKAKYVARFATEFQALDSLRVAEELDRRLQAEGRSLEVCVQINTSGETQKHGLQPEEAEAFMKRLPAFSSLRVRGLMTLAIFSEDTTQVRTCFVKLRELRERLRQTVPDGIGLDELSMGMSGDLELAIEEGATTLRIGRAIFGSRPY